MLGGLMAGVGAAIAQKPVAGASDAPILAAAWRDDGVLVPFGRLDGTVWTPVWPEVICGDGGDTVEGNSLALSDLPSAWLGSRHGSVPLHWTGFTWQGSEEVSIEPEVRRVDAHCCGTWGLPVRGAPPPERHGETQGIALSSARGARPFHELGADSPEGHRLKEYLVPMLNEAETSDLRKAASSKQEHQRYLARLFPSKAEDRISAPLDVFFVAVGGAELGTLISFRVLRRYPPPSAASNDQCGAVAIFFGWLREAKDGSLAVLERHLDLTDCDQQEVQDHFPFALVETSGRVFVLERRHGYEDESYAVLEATPHGIKQVFEKNGGGC
jgi:hypothetical protein